MPYATRPYRDYYELAAIQYLAYAIDGLRKRLFKGALYWLNWALKASELIIGKTQKRRAVLLHTALVRIRKKMKANML